MLFSQLLNIQTGGALQGCWGIILFCPWVLANQAFGTSTICEPVLHNYPPSVHNSTFLSAFMHGPSMPFFENKFSLLRYL